jgi:alpha-amylase/alpha-mannosidase (GH57 family)
MRVVLLWHMHQPDYRVGGRFLRPWVYLHALAGYSEMAAAVESVGAMRTVVNFTPVLLDQIDDYDRRLRAWRRRHQPVGDALLDALVAPPAPGRERADVVAACLSARGSARARRHPHYVALAESASGQDPAALSDERLGDLLVLFHLLWLGGSARNGDARVGRLLGRAGGFGRDERLALVELVADSLARVLPRWRALDADGRVELSTSPYYHPLSPLLLDFGSALDRAPSTTLPAQRYPGGEARLRWQIREGLARFESLVGRRAAGCWPPEAAVSDATLALLAGDGFEWAASSQAVLQASYAHEGSRGEDHFRLFRSPDTGIHCAFRDDGLSDRIGFEYQHWQPADAVRDLVRHLETIAREPGRELVLIALDGENPWEYYPDDGRDFLLGVYRALTSHAALRPATLRDCVLELGPSAAALPPLRAGSWVHGELLTWVGHPEKNRAWELLIEAKRRFDGVVADAALEHRLGACEGSDWFWWPGVHNPTPAVAQFDALYRAQLSALYAALGLPPPRSLAAEFASGVSHEVAAGGTMQKST